MSYISHSESGEQLVIRIRSVSSVLFIIIPNSFSIPCHPWFTFALKIVHGNI